MATKYETATVNREDAEEIVLEISQSTTANSYRRRS